MHYCVWRCAESEERCDSRPRRFTQVTPVTQLLTPEVYQSRLVAVAVTQTQTQTQTQHAPLAERPSAIPILQVALSHKSKLLGIGIDHILPWSVRAALASALLLLNLSKMQGPDSEPHCPRFPPSRLRHSNTHTHLHCTNPKSQTSESALCSAVSPSRSTPYRTLHHLNLLLPSALQLPQDVSLVLSPIHHLSALLFFSLSASSQPKVISLFRIRHFLFHLNLAHCPHTPSAMLNPHEP